MIPKKANKSINRSAKSSTEKTVRTIKRATRRKYSAEEKIRIVLAGLRGEDSVAELCRTEDINPNIYTTAFCCSLFEVGKCHLHSSFYSREIKVNPYRGTNRRA